MDGVRLAALFSYMPNKLEYCGPKEASTLFYSYLKNNRNKDKVKELLVKFEALYPYLKVIAEGNERDLFDYDVVEAYWLGNKLAELDEKAAIRLIKMLNKRGLMDSVAKKLIKRLKKLDEKAISLTHLFHVVFVGVGAVTGSVPAIIENMDKCRISWGSVCEIRDSYLVVERNRLKNKDNEYFIDKNPEKVRVDYDRNFFTDLNTGDVVATHWGLAVKKLSSKELKNLKVYTQKVIELISRP